MDVQIQNTVGEYFEVDISNNLTVAEFCVFYAKEMELEDVEVWDVKMIFGQGEEQELNPDDVIYEVIKNPLVDYVLIGPKG
jgi:hypothetical protein